jgi:hypothetical protein
VHGRYTIASVYFDTDTYDIVRASVQKPLFKEKLRLRWYGDTAPQEPVFLELKRKYRGMVYKRRVPVGLPEASRLLQTDLPVLGQSQIANEVNWFIRRYRPVPKLLLVYDREALQGREDNGLRITFDHDIRWRSDDFTLSRGSCGAPLLDTDMVLMEIKACGNLPIWLTELLASEKIYPTSFSKYGAWYEQHYLTKGTKQYVG